MDDTSGYENDSHGEGMDLEMDSLISNVLEYVPSKDEIQAAVFDTDEGFYVQEALDAGCDYGYFKYA